eukprot:3781107-Rhodomonas_salina.1
MLMLVFGLPQGSCSGYLKDSKTVLLQTFRAIPEARVEWQSLEKMKEYAELISGRQPELQGVFTFVNGLNLAIFEPPPWHTALSRMHTTTGG